MAKISAWVCRLRRLSRSTRLLPSLPSPLRLSSSYCCYYYYSYYHRYCSSAGNSTCCRNSSMANPAKYSAHPTLRNYGLASNFFCGCTTALRRSSSYYNPASIYWRIRWLAVIGAAVLCSCCCCCCSPSANTSKYSCLGPRLKNLWQRTPVRHGLAISCALRLRANDPPLR